MIQIGAGIQIAPNVSVLLQRWGVDKVIGDNLVQIEELNMRRKDGIKVGYTNIPILEKPWDNFGGLSIALTSTKD